MRSPTTAAPRSALDSGRCRRSVYTVADHNLFLGAVALVNSLRLLGYEGRVVLLDCGLSHRERDVLAAEVELVDRSLRRPATLLKWQAPLYLPADEMLLLDSDVIVTQPLDLVFDRIAKRRIVAAADAYPDRFFAEWETLLSLPSLRRGTYVNAGLIGLPGPETGPLLEAVRARQLRLDLSLTRLGGAALGSPLYHGDQNVWNALLCSDPWAEMVDVLDGRFAPQFPFRGVEVADARLLHCVSASGVEPLLLHHILAKPWLKPVRRNAYIALLGRLLAEDDVAIRPPRELLPTWLRPDLPGRVHRLGYDAAAILRSQRGRLGIRRRLARPRGAAASPSPG